MHGILISDKQIETGHFLSEGYKKKSSKKPTKNKILFFHARLMPNYIPMQISFFHLIFSLNHDDLTGRQYRDGKGMLCQGDG